MVPARTPAHASEIELKLEFAPAELARLTSHPALQVSGNPPEQRDLVSIYFDTPDHALHKAGVYLRIREISARFVQTVKAAKSQAALLERHEWEREVSGPTPDLDGAKGTALEPLLTPKVRASLQPAFETRIRRTLCRVARDETEIEVAIDRGEIGTTTQRCPVYEIELELKKGEVKELFRLAQLVGEDVPLRLEVKTKAERGYELLCDGRLRPERATEIDIAPDVTAGAAFRIIAWSCLRQIVANEPPTCRGQAEALHQMRIGLRRLRAAIAIFAGVVGDDQLEKIKGELRWITRELGPARDLDVFAADVLNPLQASRPSDEAVVAAHADFEAKRATAYATAIGAVQSARFRAAMLDVAEWIETDSWTGDDDEKHTVRRERPVAEHARRELVKLRKWIKAKGGRLRQLSVPKRHRLRIRAKRLRYGTEFFAATFPGAASATRRTESLKALKDLQDALGGLNDLATHQTLIAGGDEDAAKDQGGAVAGEQLDAAEAKAKTLLLEAEQAFARFAGAKPFWKP
jgi:inorganic triphosphatase YgiF